MFNEISKTLTKIPSIIWLVGLFLCGVVSGSLFFEEEIPPLKDTLTHKTIVLIPQQKSFLASKPNKADRPPLQSEPPTEEPEVPFKGEDGSLSDPKKLSRILLILSPGSHPVVLNRLVNDFPDEVGIAVLPAGNGRQTLPSLQKKYAKKHAVFLLLPMEPTEYPQYDPGPNTLLTGLCPSENLKRLETHLGDFAELSGVIDFMGSRFVTKSQDLTPILKELQRRKIFIVDTHAAPRGLISQVCEAQKIPHLTCDKHLNLGHDQRELYATLFDLEEVAEEKGTAVAMLHLYPAQVDHILAWINQLARKGIQLATIDQLVDVPESS